MSTISEEVPSFVKMSAFEKFKQCVFPSDARKFGKKKNKLKKSKRFRKSRNSGGSQESKSSSSSEENAISTKNTRKKDNRSTLEIMEQYICTPREKKIYQTPPNINTVSPSRYIQYQYFNASSSKNIISNAHVSPRQIRIETNLQISDTHDNRDNRKNRSPRLQPPSHISKQHTHDYANHLHRKKHRKKSIDKSKLRRKTN
jgi:hypothetical protein